MSLVHLMSPKKAYNIWTSSSNKGRVSKHQIGLRLQNRLESMINYIMVDFLFHFVLSANQASDSSLVKQKELCKKKELKELCFFQFGDKLQKVILSCSSWVKLAHLCCYLSSRGSYFILFFLSLFLP